MLGFRLVRRPGVSNRGCLLFVLVFPPAMLAAMLVVRGAQEVARFAELAWRQPWQTLLDVGPIVAAVAALLALAWWLEKRNWPGAKR